MHDPDYWKFSNEDGKLDRQYGGGGKHSDFVKSVEEAVAYSKEIERNPLSALTPAQLAAIRSVILEVIDEGKQIHGLRWKWDIDDFDEDYANQQRLDFCDEIARRIVARGAPAADHDFRPLPQNPNWCAFYGCTRSRENHGAPATVG